jgi:hypothetical protein
MAYEWKPMAITAVTLGVVSGFAVLTKGSLILIPFLLFTMIFIRTIIRKDSGGMKRLCILMASTLFTVLPWSLYASIRSDKVIILSTQGTPVLLEMNNEYCIDGGWHPEYSQSSESFYNNDGIDKSRTLLKVGNFYWKNPRLFFQIMSKKLINGFSPFVYFWLFIIFVLLNEICRLGLKWLKVGYLQLFFLIVILTTSFLVSYYIRTIILSIVQIRISILMILLFGIFGWLIYLYKSGKLSVPIPTSFLVIWGNFLIMTLISGAISRYILPMNFIFILLCFVSGLHLLFWIWDNLIIQTINNTIDYSGVQD